MKTLTKHRPRTVTWLFKPLRDLETGRPRARVFLQEWKKMMGDEEQITDIYFLENEGGAYPILEVLDGNRHPDQRDTQIATTLIGWLGTNIGQEFLETGRRLSALFKKEMPLETERAFLAAWALRSPTTPYQCQGIPLRQIIAGIGEPLTDRDVRTMERVVFWLGSDKGQAFLESCENEWQKCRPVFALVPKSDRPAP